MAVKTSKKRFLIFGSGRTGSTLFVQMLRSHPDIYCEGGIFSPNHNSWNIARHRILLPVIKRFPDLFIWWKAMNAPSPVYGFKLQTIHVHHPRPLVSRLYNDGWRIFHVQRRSEFDQAVSALFAEYSGRYHRKASDAVSEPPKFEINADCFLERLQFQRKLQRIEDETLMGMENMKILYEDDLMDGSSWDRLADRVFRFLGIRPVSIQVRIVPTWDTPYSSMIKNYGELISVAENGNFTP